MLRFLAVAVLASSFVVIGLAVFAGLHGAALLDGVKVTIDGESFDGGLLAGGLGGAIVLGVLAVGLIVLAILASLALVVPTVIAAVLAASSLAVVTGLVSLAAPVLLVVGAYVLLSRWSKRRRARASASLHASTCTSTP